MTNFVVIAFGGNAILPSSQQGTLAEQRENVRRMSVQLGQLVLDGHRVVVTHGNGPQVGEIMLRSELLRDAVPALTLDVAGAMTQGQIGYMLQQEIGNFLAAHDRHDSVCSVVSQVTVNPDDRAFAIPTKPIGRFYSVDEAATLRSDRGWDMVEDAGRGYRRVVPSPMPVDIVEWPAVKALLEAGALVIATGGGGVPVVRDENGGLRGVEAVIDKDLASERLASLIGAGTLILLTEIDQVSINFGTTEQRPLGVVSLDEMKKHVADGQFPAGSMGPKVQAAVRFLEEGGQRVIITSPSNLVAAMDTHSVGTQMLSEVPTLQESGATLRSGTR